MRMGVFTALAIAIHNFPEGLATFVSALQEPGLAIPVVVAIAIHNIPEGIAVSVPIYQATGSRSKAFRYSFLSGSGGAFGGAAWLVGIAAHYERYCVRCTVCRSGGNHGVYLL